MIKMQEMEDNSIFSKMDRTQPAVIKYRNLRHI